MWKRFINSPTSEHIRYVFYSFLYFVSSHVCIHVRYHDCSWSAYCLVWHAIWITVVLSYRYGVWRAFCEMNSTEPTDCIYTYIRSVLVQLLYFNCVMMQFHITFKRIPHSSLNESMQLLSTVSTCCPPKTTWWGYEGGGERSEHCAPVLGIWWLHHTCRPTWSCLMCGSLLKNESAQAWINKMKLYLNSCSIQYVKCSSYQLVSTVDLKLAYVWTVKDWWISLKGLL